MSVITSIGIIILAMLIFASLQATPGIFTLFSHYAFGKYSKPKASDFILFYIIGVEVINVFLFLSIFYLSNILFLQEPSFENNAFAWILSGILISLGISTLFLYFRRSKGTKLFIPRKYALAIDYSASSVKSRSDAFILGIYAGTCELIYTLPVQIAVSFAIINLDIMSLTNMPLIFLYSLSPLIPLFILYWKFRSGHNLAEIQRTRVKNKNFTRFFLCICYLLLAVLIICTRVIK